MSERDRWSKVSVIMFAFSSESEIGHKLQSVRSKARKKAWQQMNGMKFSIAVYATRGRLTCHSIPASVVQINPRRIAQDSSIASIGNTPQLLKTCLQG